MKKIAKIMTLLITSLSISCFGEVLNENNINQIQELITFNRPKGWKTADTKELSPLIKTMLIGTGKEEFPPTITIAIEPFEGTLKDYLKIVKNINDDQKTEWKNLGKMTTKAGVANLSQYDEKSNWGLVRTMTAILVKNGNAYILSATALKSEFSGFYKDFFEAMKSFSIENTGLKN